MSTTTTPRPKTKKKRLDPLEEAHLLYKDPARQAELAGLRYATDDKPGITRKATRAGNFTYTSAKGEKITDQKVLDRIHGYVIPPAWTDVWISPSANAHLQVTGRDAKGRKQYRYHPAWDQARSLTKFSRLRAFGEQLPALRQRLRKDLGRPKLDKQKVIALVLLLMDQSFIRVGNREYAKKNKSYGLTTLRDKHVKIEGDDVRFSFVGKKGVPHDVTLHDRKLARLVRKCKDIPGQHLFQYYDATGHRAELESGDVNDYLHEVTGMALSAKDFRTWGGTVKMVTCLEAILEEEPDLPKDKVLKRAVKDVAAGLGNTPTVCSKYYIHPQVVDLFKSDKLIDYLRRHDVDPTENDLLSPTEHMVLDMLAEVK
ncbi:MULTISPECIES: DNA topoisomerase IB [Hymenobacter]|uniref:DNA topoisomerase n=2 Tax=Hymenobacter TaxID=89966 RepID=A0ABS6WW96_9BACT|nr:MULTISPECIES: DNA topoisomerase IB [Hymenobacter]MBO3269644.1 DNA topoisomerase IB [Hymenobacter defluvii]MBW3127004.1 DNA topoisomerase IB [Hymenobacter profundi]MBW3127005.1 DNA topoisomerase IB [Hymenobacter profundi]QNE39307.1 DNA topoisomerase IB [Hymenobacter sp. NBH84]